MRWPRRAKGRLAAQVPPPRRHPTASPCSNSSPIRRAADPAAWLDSRSRNDASRGRDPEFSDGDYVVVVRYLTPAWRRAIEGSPRPARRRGLLHGRRPVGPRVGGPAAACPRRLDMRALRQVGPSPAAADTVHATRRPGQVLRLRLRGGCHGDVAFAGFVRDGVDGLLPNEPARWIEALVALVNDAPRLARSRPPADAGAPAPDALRPMRLTAGAEGVFPIAPTRSSTTAPSTPRRSTAWTDFYLACGATGITVLGQLGGAEARARRGRGGRDADDPARRACRSWSASPPRFAAMRADGT